MWLVYFLCHCQNLFWLKSWNLSCDTTGNAFPTPKRRLYFFRILCKLIHESCAVHFLQDWLKVLTEYQIVNLTRGENFFKKENICEILWRILRWQKCLFSTQMGTWQGPLCSFYSWEGTLRPPFSDLPQEEATFREQCLSRCVSDVI